MQTAVLPIDPDNALAALTEASRAVGLDADGVELVRLGSNAMFRYRSAPVIGRVAPSVSRFAAAEREVTVARWLAEEGVPAVRALNVRQPVVAQGRVITFWESASDVVEYGSTRELAGLLRRLHALTPPFTLPEHDPISKAADRLHAIDGLPHDDRQFLVGRCEALAEGYTQIEPVLAPGVIHGDANVGNVIRDRADRAILADLDNFAIGPREWDLVLTALYYERFGWHTEEEYRDLVAAYGFDIMQWSGYPVMRDVRELLMVTWLAQKSQADRDAASELATRIQALRTGSSRRDWKPF